MTPLTGTRFNLMKQNNLRFFIAARDGELPIVARLLATGIDINGANAGGATALEMAATAGQTEIVAFLIEHGARFDPLESPCFSSALISAATKHHVGTVEMLLAHGADPNVRDEQGQTALMWAVFHNSPLSIVEMLLLKGATAAATDIRGNTALDYAVEAKNEHACVLLRQQTE